MDALERHLDELIDAANRTALEPLKPIEVCVKEIDDQIRDIQNEKEKAPERAVRLDISIRSLENMREGYLALAREEAEEATHVVSELNRWPSPVRAYDLAAVAEG